MSRSPWAGSGSGYEGACCPSNTTRAGVGGSEAACCPSNTTIAAAPCTCGEAIAIHALILAALRVIKPVPVRVVFLAVVVAQHLGAIPGTHAWWLLLVAHRLCCLLVLAACSLPADQHPLTGGRGPNVWHAQILCKCSMCNRQTLAGPKGCECRSHLEGLAIVCWQVCPLRDALLDGCNERCLATPAWAGGQMRA